VANEPSPTLPAPSVPLAQAGSGPAQDFADAVLGFLAAARRTRGRMQPLFDDVTVPQLVLLDAVQACGGQGIGAIAQYTGLSQPTVTRGAATLEQAGLLKRDPAGEDSRRRVLTITEHGQTLLDEKRAVVIGHLSTAWNLLDDRERELAGPLLRRLADLVEHLL
jgi:MarR family transcriptional regulator, organic hydroperoxide resistance regulator